MNTRMVESLRIIFAPIVFRSPQAHRHESLSQVHAKQARRNGFMAGSPSLPVHKSENRDIDQMRAPRSMQGDMLSERGQRGSDRSKGAEGRGSAPDPAEGRKALGTQYLGRPSSWRGVMVSKGPEAFGGEARRGSAPPEHPHTFRRRLALRNANTRCAAYPPAEPNVVIRQALWVGVYGATLSPRQPPPAVAPPS